MFLAYDQVLFAQYPHYEKYALLTPGPEAKTVALDILQTSQGDAVVKALNTTLYHTVKRNSVVPIEYHLFAIRNTAGNEFDVYLLDEDSIFLACAGTVAESNVVKMGEALLEAVSILKRSSI